MIALFEQEEITPPTKSNEWYTPSRYIEAARKVMGSIDLDPASCEMANRTVKATRYYSIEDNGLSKQWHGNVWLNPPFAKVDPRAGGFLGSYQGRFVRYLLSEYQKGNVKQAVLLLLGNCCFNSYFTPLWNHLLCFNEGTVYFMRPDGNEGHYGFGTIFVYLGSNEAAFIEHFSPFGRIAKAIDTPKPSPSTRSLWEEA